MRVPAIEAAKRDLGWAPKTDMDTAIRRTIDYYVKQENFGARVAALALSKTRSRRPEASIGASMAIEAGMARARVLGWVPWLVLAAAWCVAMQVRPLFDPDEGRYAEIPREMVASWRLAHAALRRPEIFRKAAPAVLGDRGRLFDVRCERVDVAAVDCRAGIRLSAHGVWLDAAAIRSDGALAAVVALCVSPYFAIIGHLDLLDAGFAFWLTGAVFAFTLAQSAAERSRDERRWMLVAWAAAALAILSKGIVVGVLTGASLIIYSAIERDIRPWKRLHAAVGVPLFLLVGAPWFIAVSVRNPDFPGFFFIHEHFARFLTTVHQRVEPWWFFLPPLLLGVFPWGRAFIGACGAIPGGGGGSRAGAPGTGPGPRFRPLRFLLIFSVFTLAFFSASGSKLYPYIQPMFPPLAAILGVYVAERAGFLRTTALITAILITVVSAGVLIYSAIHNSFIPQSASIWAAVAVLAMGIAVVASRGPRAPEGGGPDVVLDRATPAVVVAAGAALAWSCFMTALGALRRRGRPATWWRP